MEFDCTAELAKLMQFTGETATAIRMYSAYSNGVDSYLNIPRDPQRDSVDLMFLSDALHNFSTLGRALLDGNPTTIATVCDGLLFGFDQYESDEGTPSARRGKPTFERWKSHVDLNLARKAIAGIRHKAMLQSEI